MLENKESIVNYLSKNTVLKSIDKTEIAKFIDSGDIHFYNEKELILTEHDSGTTLFFIISGSVDIVKLDEEKDVYICTLGTGEFFGEAGLFTTMERTATVVASESDKNGTTILKIERDNFIKFIKPNPAAGIKILMLIIYSLIKKLKTVNQELAFERKLDFGQDDIDNLISSLL